MPRFSVPSRFHMPKSQQGMGCVGSMTERCATRHSRGLQGSQCAQRRKCTQGLETLDKKGQRGQWVWPSAARAAAGCAFKEDTSSSGHQKHTVLGSVFREGSRKPHLFQNNILQRTEGRGSVLGGCTLAGPTHEGQVTLERAGT